MKKEIGVLEDFCPFCGKPSGEATITLSPIKFLKGITKAIGNPCPECIKFLDAGDIGFLYKDGSGIILQKDKGLEILDLLGLQQFYNPEKRNVIKIMNPNFWRRQFQPIIDKQRRTHGNKA